LTDLPRPRRVARLWPGHCASSGRGRSERASTRTDIRARSRKPCQITAEHELGAYYEPGNLAREPREIASGVALAEVERSRGSTELKYLMASLSLSGQMFDRSTQPFQDFSTLMKIRNDLMHPRPLDKFDDAGVTVPPSYVREFERRRHDLQARSRRLRLVAQRAGDRTDCFMGHVRQRWRSSWRWSR
jgi:hypothetical protein